MWKTELNDGRKKVEAERSHLPYPETDAGTLPSKPQPHSNTQINRSGLNYDVRVSQYEARTNGPSSDLINTVSVWFF